MTDANPRKRGLGRWLSWLVGIAALVAVVVAATHIAEPREFARIVERAERSGSRSRSCSSIRLADAVRSYLAPILSSWD